MRLVAWLGGAIFVSSLALFAWWYLVPLGRVTGWTGTRPLLFDAALVTLFASHHSLFARDAVKRRLTGNPGIPAAMVRSFYVWIASALLIVVVLAWQRIGGEWYDVSGPQAVAHALVQIAGVWLIAQAVRGLDPLELAGIRQATGTTSPQEPLQVGGPYRWVRHPLYLGWMLALFGSAHMTGDRLAVAALTSLYLVVAVPWEERALMKSFGEEYARYAARVRWRIVPFIY